MAVSGRAKRVLVIIAITAVIGMAYALYQWYKPQRDASKEKGIPITAQALIEAYKTNQQAADAQYLDKTLVVSGTVVKTGTNQQGQRTAELQTDKAGATIFCTIALAEHTPLAAGQQVVLKGICKGFRDQLMVVDVVLQDCYVIR
jgi:hypothetical protein